MKFFLTVLGFACLISIIHASPLKIQEVNENRPQVLPNFEEKKIMVDAPPRPPQVHHNTVLGQGPLAGRLLNVVQNYKGEQDVAQRNSIQYSFHIQKGLEYGIEALKENTED